MTPEDRVGVLLHVSVSDVQPHIDHAARALSTHRRRHLRWQYASAGFVVGVALLALVASTFTGWRHRAADPATDSWSRAVSLDGGHLTLSPPAPGSQPPLTRAEAMAAFLADPQSAETEVVAAHWGLSTVRSQSGARLPTFDQRPSWAIIFRMKSTAVTCPPPASRPLAGSGDYSDVRVFLLAPGGQHAMYSQPSSWGCGLPPQPVTTLPETVG